MSSRGGAKLHDRRGIALLMVLWVLALITVLAMSFSLATKQEDLSTRNFSDESRAYYAATAAYEEVVSYLGDDKDPTVDYIDDEGNFVTDKERPPVEGKRVVDGIELNIKLSDEESRLNINNIGPDVLKRLFLKAGISQDETAELVDCTLDWRGPANAHRVFGTDSSYYESLDPPYRCKNLPFDSVAELMLVKGFKMEYLYGGGETAPIADLLTVYGKGLNINTVSRDVLEALGANELDIDQLMSDRSAQKGLRFVPGIFTELGVVLTASTHFRIEVSARAVGSHQVVKIFSVVERVDGADGGKLRNIYWRENFEAGSA